MAPGVDTKRRPNIAPNAAKPKRLLASAKKADGSGAKASVMEAIETNGNLAVVRAYTLTTVRKTIDTYVKAGLKVIAVSTSCPGWVEAVRRLRKTRPEVIVGVGGCSTPLRCKTAVASGAQFIVSPTFNEALIKEAARLKTPILPKCGTPAEMQRAHALGCPMVSIFAECALPVTLQRSTRRAVV